MGELSPAQQAAIIAVLQRMGQPPLTGLPPGMPSSLMPISTTMPQLPTNNPGYPSNLPTPIRRPMPF